MTQQWYVYHNGQVLGPYTWEHLQTAVRDHSFSAEDLTKNDQMPDWVSIGQLTGLVPAGAMPASNPSYSGVPARQKTKKPAVIILVSLMVLMLIGVAAFLLVRLLAADAQLQVSSVVVSIAVDEQDRPVGITSEFAPDAAEIFVSAKLEAVKRPSTLRSVWIWETEHHAFGSYDLQMPRGATVAIFSFTRPDQGWPGGHYRVELYQDETLLGVARYEVVRVDVAVFEYQDDFASFDASVWMVVRGNSSDLGYGADHDDSAFQIEEDQLLLYQDITDNGPFLHSMPFTVSRGDVVTVTRQVFIQPANDKLLAGMTLYMTDETTLSSTFTEPLVNVQYLYYSWAGDSHQGEWDCFLFNERKWDDKRNPIPINNPLPPIWGEWFTETIVYDTGTNQAVYYLNDTLVASAPAFNDFAEGPVKLVVNPYGWHTGHLTALNWIYIEVTPADALSR